MGNCLRCRNIESSVDIGNSDAQLRIESERRRSRLPPYYENDPIMHPTPGVSRPMSQLTEEEQVRIATRMGLISTLPLFKFDESKREKLSECIICMCEYEEGEELRYLPCLHTYHRICIDDWLMRALTCPSCLEEIRPNSPVKVRSNTSSQTTTVNESVENNAVPQTNESSVPLSCHQQVNGQSVNECRRISITERRSRNVQSSNLYTHSETVQRFILERLKNHSNGDTSGDITDNFSHTSRHYQPQHRRTRSIGPSRLSYSINAFNPALPYNYRRGNSVTAIDMISPIVQSSVEDNSYSINNN
ncbi:RING finger protein isoform 2 [Schistosoma japonicum]|uniref:RING finger protein 11 n=1 Tax=Schistosoma japonicum TaxID=6182 RepID=C1L4C0_SCHJA|nr:RING finger protein 11 [Schistosoma japonicum]KAH8873386.1 RING finger protein 11 [Schistosoma japonicum]TNN20729.1 RING finger protein isoform 2 [Schistosoma japonicum]TNN20731.1 RING finger protein isoform 2 [Schistosoma japonicum]CAX69548.1 RING finger protein 11 [Schistosoma japonicum]